MLVQNIEDDCTLKYMYQHLTVMSYIMTLLLILANKKTRAEDLAHNVVALLQSCNDNDVLITVQEHLQSAISVLKAKTYEQSNSYFTPTITPPNANHQKQLRFFSTKKRKK